MRPHFKVQAGALQAFPCRFCFAAWRGVLLPSAGISDQPMIPSVFPVFPVETPVPRVVLQTLFAFVYFQIFSRDGVFCSSFKSGFSRLDNRRFVYRQCLLSAFSPAAAPYLPVFES